MTPWADLSASTRAWVMAFIVIVIVLVIFAAMGFYWGAWSTP